MIASLISNNIYAVFHFSDILYNIHTDLKLTLYSKILIISFIVKIKVKK